MIYNIPYNQNFIDVLLNKVLNKKHLLILPGKYLTDKVASEVVQCISYDDLWFKVFPNRATNIAESILIDRVINRKVNSNHLVKNALKKAVNEFFYYGLQINDLVLLNNQHAMMYEVVAEIIQEINSNNVSLRASTLYELLNGQSEIEQCGKFFSNRIVYAVLPKIFSPLLYKILKIFHKDLGVNIVLNGYDKSLNYEISQEHPQFYMQEFLKSIEVGAVVDLISDSTKHPDTINRGVLEMLYPPSMLHLMHSSKLYDFKHVGRFTSTSTAEEFYEIVRILCGYIANNSNPKVAIVSRKAEKIKMIYKYLKNSSILNTLNKTLILTTSAPTYCSDYEHLKLFLKILENVGSREENISDIFTILKHPAANTYNYPAVLSAEKYLLGIEGLNVHDLKRVVSLLEKNEMQEAAQLINKISQFKNITSGKYPEINLEITHEVFDGIPENKFEKILKAHLICFFSIISKEFIENDATNEILKILLEAKNCFRNLSNNNVNFREYKSIITSLLNRHVISANEKHIVKKDTEDVVEIDVMTSIEARFLSYDFTIICDLKEDTWPPESEDHYFISEQTRRKFEYSKPATYEIGYAASDFISILATSGEVMISEFHETEVFDVIKKASIESRFLSLLYAYQKIGGFENKLLNKPVFATQADEINAEVALMKVPVDQRPKSFSATSLERLMKNPYLYSVEYNLKLKYLPKFFNEKAQPPSNKDFGIVIHNILHKVSNALDTYESLEKYREVFLKITDEVLQQRYGKYSVYRMRLWEGKINNIIDYMYDYNSNLYQKSGEVLTETEKRIAVDISLNDEIDIQLQAYTDRIDHTRELTYICDYKTGQLPTKNEIVKGLKPQLSFEGMIMNIMDLNKKVDLLNDDFESIPVKKIVLRYIRVTGISVSNEIKDIDFDFKSTVNGITGILKSLYLESLPYASTEKYDNYLQAHIMGILSTIEHKF